MGALSCYRRRSNALKNGTKCRSEALEARLARGEGVEHPDWEDSIEWRNAAQTLQRTEKMWSLLEWLLLWEHGGRYLQRMGGCLLFVILVASLLITLTLLHDFLINI